MMMLILLIRNDKSLIKGDNNLMKYKYSLRHNDRNNSADSGKYIYIYGVKWVGKDKMHLRHTRAKYTPKAFYLKA